MNNRSCLGSSENDSWSCKAVSWGGGVSSKFFGPCSCVQKYLYKVLTSKKKALLNVYHSLVPIEQLLDKSSDIRQRFNGHFSVPDLLLSKVCFDSNGFSGYEPVMDVSGNLKAYNSYFGRIIAVPSLPSASVVQMPTAGTT